MNADYHDLPFGITRIDTHYIRPRLAAAYLLVEHDRAAFIETGPLLAASRLMNGVERAGLKPEDVEAIIVTHVHLDHAGGAGELMRLCPKAKLIVHASGARHLIDPTKLKASALAVYGENLFKETLGDIVAAEAHRVVVPQDGDILTIGGRELTLIETPGHAHHHLCVWDATSRGLFTGDAFGISYREFDGGTLPYLFPPTTPVQLDPERFHQSLDRLAARQPETLYLTHFDAIPYQPALLQTLHDQLNDYVAMAKRAGLAGKDRHQRLLTALKEHAHKILNDIQSPLPFQEGDSLLAPDQEINAQGLEVWFDRLERDK